MFSPVIADTDFTWPTFSATRMNTTGRNRPRVETEKAGVWNSGKPIHAAWPTLEKSTSPWMIAAT